MEGWQKVLLPVLQSCPTKATGYWSYRLLRLQASHLQCCKMDKAARVRVELWGGSCRDGHVAGTSVLLCLPACLPGRRTFDAVATACMWALRRPGTGQPQFGSPCRIQWDPSFDGDISRARDTGSQGTAQMCWLLPNIIAHRGHLPVVCGNITQQKWQWSSTSLLQAPIHLNVPSCC